MHYLWKLKKQFLLLLVLPLLLCTSFASYYVKVPQNWYPKEPIQKVREDSVKVLNQLRSEVWAWPLVLNDEFNRFAQSFADDMCTKNYYQWHTRLDGKNFPQRITEWWLDRNKRILTENMGMTNASVYNAFAIWFAWSPSHSYNQLNKAHTNVWVWQCKKRWVVIFGTPRYTKQWVKQVWTFKPSPQILSRFRK